MRSVSEEDVSSQNKNVQRNRVPDTEEIRIFQNHKENYQPISLHAVQKAMQPRTETF